MADREGTRAIERARAAGNPTAVVSPKGGPEALGARVAAACEEAGASLMCMAGFLRLMRILPAWRGRVVNIHPSLLPSFGGKGFYGIHVHEAVLAYGAKVTGCTVHFADDAYDHGPIIIQRSVPVRDDDTPETLQERVFAEECEAYPEAIRLFAEGRLRIVLPTGAPDAGARPRVRVLPG